MMLLDEPATYLDLSSQFRLMRLLRELCGEGHGVAVVMHDLALALECADEVLLMKQGRIVEKGSPEQLTGNVRASGVQPLYDRYSLEDVYLYYLGDD